MSMLGLGYELSRDVRRRLRGEGPARRRHPVRGAAALLVLCACGMTLAQNTIERADAAMRDGDLSRALTLYDETLVVEPENVRALLASAKLLSWDKRFDEAIARYDRLLAVAPEHDEAAFERGKVLSWDRRYREAVAAFEAMLDREPDDIEIRTALGRTLSWKGDYGAARDEFARVLERDPRHQAAIVGTAQTYAWSGRLAQARTWYHRALEVDPDDRDATLGLAYVHLWAGDAATADSMADRLNERFPDNDEVQELHARTRDAAGPWVRAAVERLDDTDDNRLDVYQISGGRSLHGPVDLVASASRFDMSDPVADASIDSIQAGVDVRLALGQLVTVRVGVDRREETTGQRETETIGGLSYVWGLDRAWRGTVSATRAGLRYSPTITDNGVIIDELAFDLGGRVGDRWRLFLDGGTAKFRDELSQDNRRDRLRAGFARRLRARAPQLEAGYAVSYMDFSDDLDLGYFDPADFLSHLAQLRGRGEWGARRNTYSFMLDYGLQSFTLGGVDTDNDSVVSVTGILGFPVGRGFNVQLFANWGDYAAQTASGFESRQLGLRLRWSGE